MKTVGVCVCGAQHKQEGCACQDRVYAYSGDDFSMIAVSDGAGSKRYAAQSAELLVRTTQTFFETIARDPIGAFDRGKFIKEVQQAFRRRSYSETEAGATLLFAVSDGKRYLVGHMGDGAAILSRRERLSILSQPENGMYANETFFFPSRDAQRHFRVIQGEAKKGDGILLASDGAADCLYDPNTGQVANACRMMVQWTREYDRETCAQILENNLKNVFSEYSSDDKSVAVLCVNA